MPVPAAHVVHWPTHVDDAQQYPLHMFDVHPALPVHAAPAAPGA
jgi:hypothetical protein